MVEPFPVQPVHKAPFGDEVGDRFGRDIARRTGSIWTTAEPSDRGIEDAKPPLERHPDTIGVRVWYENERMLRFRTLCRTLAGLPEWPTSIASRSAHV